MEARDWHAQEYREGFFEFKSMEKCRKRRAGHDISFKAWHKAAKKARQSLAQKLPEVTQEVLQNSLSTVLIIQDTKTDN